ncbi:(2Fe-2S)-binding protein [Capillimicrobium parvum]|uniref:Caffeine dehydrogenase subunit gamma n=1 Tax=Capillimicrobium parvum TaxID=2884022 RepID=A0A9E6Y1H2_9ACTN|nr:(2Fe-2S)-binding protein [Capillimicrobium parvum]UGS38216.1 Caffeine dehydrogenase subunit gamma [Capillimicrobium parvum]
MSAISEASVTVEVNGRRYRRQVPVRRLLSDFLRHDLGLTGTHVGCEHGVCGACNVRVDGELVRACLMLAVQADGRRVQTIEGLADGELHPVQRALLEHYGLQCGFCTPGVAMTLSSITERAPLDDEQISEELSGNLCRCTGYAGILAAARAVAGAAPTPPIDPGEDAQR